MQETFFAILAIGLMIIVIVSIFIKTVNFFTDLLNKIGLFIIGASMSFVVLYGFNPDQISLAIGWSIVLGLIFAILIPNRKVL